MVTSGVATRKAIDLDFEDESESAVHVMVHDLKPPFLDGRSVYTKQLEPINPIRDATSDMAVFAKKGSRLAVVADLWHREDDCEYPFHALIE